MKRSLQEWVDQHTGKSATNGDAISIALLETAIDRHIRLYGDAAALDSIRSCFDRRAQKFPSLSE
jgi:hypothetical protein